MPMIEIKTVSGKTLYVCEAESAREAAERAVAKNANLAGANLADANLADGGLRSDGYRFFLTGFDSEGWRIKAGCRDFNFDEARRHWSRPDRTLDHEATLIVEQMIVRAKMRGWDVDKWDVDPAKDVAPEAVESMGEESQL